MHPGTRLIGFFMATALLALLPIGSAIMVIVSGMVMSAKAVLAYLS